MSDEQPKSDDEGDGEFKDATDKLELLASAEESTTTEAVSAEIGVTTAEGEGSTAAGDPIAVSATPVASVDELTTEGAATTTEGDTTSADADVTELTEATEKLDLDMKDDAGSGGEDSADESDRIVAAKDAAQVLLSPTVSEKGGRKVLEDSTVIELASDDEEAFADSEVQQINAEDAENASPGDDERLDDDEDQAKPAFVPRQGRFYQHDDRTPLGEDELGPQRDRNSERRTHAAEKTGKWGHDLYDDRLQQPRTKADMIRRYGFDIRDMEKPPDESVEIRARGPRQPRPPALENNRQHTMEDFFSPGRSRSAPAKRRTQRGEDRAEEAPPVEEPLVEQPVQYERKPQRPAEERQQRPARGDRQRRGGAREENRIPVEERRGPPGKQPGDRRPQQREEGDRRPQPREEGDKRPQPREERENRRIPPQRDPRMEEPSGYPREPPARGIGGRGGRGRGGFQGPQNGHSYSDDERGHQEPRGGYHRGGGDYQDAAPRGRGRYDDDGDHYRSGYDNRDRDYGGPRGGPRGGYGPPKRGYYQQRSDQRYDQPKPGYDRHRNENYEAMNPYADPRGGKPRDGHNNSERGSYSTYDRSGSGRGGPNRGGPPRRDDEQRHRNDDDDYRYDSRRRRHGEYAEEEEEVVRPRPQQRRPQQPVRDGGGDQRRPQQGESRVSPPSAESPRDKPEQGGGDQQVRTAKRYTAQRTTSPGTQLQQQQAQQLQQLQQQQHLAANDPANDRRLDPMSRDFHPTGVAIDPMFYQQILVNQQLQAAATQFNPMMRPPQVPMYPPPLSLQQQQQISQYNQAVLSTMTPTQQNMLLQQYQMPQQQPVQPPHASYQLALAAQYLPPAVEKRSPRGDGATYFTAREVGAERRISADRPRVRNILPIIPPEESEAAAGGGGGEKKDSGNEESIAANG